MAVTREDVSPTLIPNTTMQKIFVDGRHTQYAIMPNDGYVLHDKDLDYYMEYDENDNGIGDMILGFYAGTTSVRYDYDFTANPREFYAVLKEDNIIESE